jgi:2-polyprenyl-3-methyl-5-hydroxy-6-metoxy-1,4-benzoquinol methylase
MENTQSADELGTVKTAEEEAAERTARIANSPDLWNHLWKQEGQEEWRKQALSQVYTRIERIIDPGAKIVDLGGATGILADRLRGAKNAQALVVDHSEVALEKARELGLETAIADLESDADLDRVLNREVDVCIATEVVEHLSAETRQRLFRHAAKHGRALFSVPNDRLGPDEEPQHTVKYNAMSFKRDLQQHFEHVRIEVLGPYLLGVCGWKKNFTLSVTMPCRDEAADLEATLASFRAVADEIVIGVDPRTKDNTWEIAEKYAEVVFFLQDPEGPKDDKTPEGGVHFGWVRNQCMDRCTSEWIFMTEGHERLVSGWEALLSLDQLPPQTKIGFVLRSGNDQQWAFPWLCRQDSRIRYARQTHNILDYPVGTYAVNLPQVRTLHERAIDREMARHEQRKTQNRLTLMDDWIHNQNALSLHYLGTEWRDHNENKAIERLEEYMQVPKKNGPMRYHTRLILSKLYSQRASEPETPRTEAQKAADWASARDILLGAVADDWSRTEHWVRLGDLAYREEKFEEALQWYTYAGTKIGNPPFTLWWVDLSMYSWIPAQRLAMIHGELGRFEDSLYWARKVLELLPDNAESVVFEEAKTNISLLEETINNAGRGHSERAGAV